MAHPIILAIKKCSNNETNFPQRCSRSATSSCWQQGLHQVGYNNDDNSTPCSSPSHSNCMYNFFAIEKWPQSHKSTTKACGPSLHAIHITHQLICWMHILPKRTSMSFWLSVALVALVCKCWVAQSNILKSCGICITIVPLQQWWLFKVWWNTLNQVFHYMDVQWYSSIVTTKCNDKCSSMATKQLVPCASKLNNKAVEWLQCASQQCTTMVIHWFLIVSLFINIVVCCFCHFQY